MPDGLSSQNRRLRGEIMQVLEEHQSLEAVVNDVVLKQPIKASLEEVQANLQERARAIVKVRPDLKDRFKGLIPGL